MIIKKLDFYVLRYFLAALGLSFFAMSGLYVVIHFFTNLSDFMELTQVNLPFFMGQYYLCRLPLIMYQITPIIILIASVMTIAKLIKTNEFIPIITSGLNILRMIRPILVVALIIAVGMFVIDEYTVSLLNKVINRTEKILKAEGSELFITRQAKHYAMVIQKYDYIRNEMNNVWVTEYDDEGQLQAKVFAHTVQWREASSIEDEHAAEEKNRTAEGWYFSDGAVYRYDSKGLRIGSPRIFGARGYFLAPELSSEVMEKSDGTASESMSDLENLIKQYPRQAAYKLKYYNKFSFPLTNFVLIFVGIPFILFSPSRRNFFRGIGICIAIGLGFFMLKFSLESLSKKDIIPVLLASWLPVAVFSMAALYFWRKIRM
ncbi:MAG: LptF/LptG family permease [Candidatus Brocadiia bacterium]